MLKEVILPSETVFKKYEPEMLSSRKLRITEFIIDETIIKVGSEYIWLWIAVENDNREILQISISKERKYVCRRTFYTISD